MDREATIYVIDDDASVVRFVEMSLNEAGLPVRGFLSAEDFFRQEDYEPIGCVVTDLRLPGIPGTEVPSWLRQQGSTLALVVISGLADVPTAVQLMKQGAVTILQKPIGAEELCSVVQEAIEHSRHLFAKRHRTIQVQHHMDLLTSEEREILEYMFQGASNKTILNRVSISPRTLDRRRKSILKKMDVSTVESLIALVSSTR